MKGLARNLASGLAIMLLSGGTAYLVADIRQQQHQDDRLGILETQYSNLETQYSNIEGRLDELETLLHTMKAKQDAEYQLHQKVDREIREVDENLRDHDRKSGGKAQ